MDSSTSYTSEITDFNTCSIQCAHCHQGEWELPRDTSLKRCAGCSVAMYCSKNCQKAAWPAHKQMCRSADSRDQLAGYDAPLTLLRGIEQWAEKIHHDTILALMNAAVQLQGGIAANFASPHIVVFRLVPMKDSPNPAEAFQLRMEIPEIADEEDYDWIFEGWNALEAMCQTQAAAIRARPDPGPDAYYGSLPAVFHVSDTDLTACHPYPIYGLPSLESGAALDDRTRELLENIVGMCVGSINNGLVLRKPADVGRLKPETGILVQGRRRRWKWLKMPDEWEWKRIDNADRFWTLFRQLCHGA